MQVIYFLLLGFLLLFLSNILFQLIFFPLALIKILWDKWRGKS